MSDLVEVSFKRLDEQTFDVLVNGDLKSLKPEQKTNFYSNVCKSLGLNPLTKPFDYITLNGKQTLYARKDCTDQLRKLYGISIIITSREKVDDVFAVTAQARTPDGRTDESIGVVTVGTLKGDPLANALMKAETKAKRRVTLSICGLGLLDECEIETIPSVKREEQPAYSSVMFNKIAMRLKELVGDSEDRKKYVQRLYGVGLSDLRCKTTSDLEEIYKPLINVTSDDMDLEIEAKSVFGEGVTVVRASERERI